MEDVTLTLEHITVESLKCKQEVNGKLWIPIRTGSKPELMLILASPTNSDLQEGYIGSKEYKNEIEYALKEAGITNDKIYVTSLVKYNLGDKKLTKNDISECFPMLVKEIESVKPKLIMSMGAEVFKALMQKNYKQSDYIGEIIDCPFGKLLANNSPGLILFNDPSKRPLFMDAFKKAYAFLTGGLAYTPFTYEIVTEVARGKEIVKDYIDRELFDLAYDGEWSTDGNMHNNLEILYTMQFCCVENHAIILDLMATGVENKELLDTFKPLVEHPKANRLGWNIRADDKRLMWRGFNIPEETLSFDGMKAVAFFDNRYGKGLETGISQFTNYESYYTDFYLELKHNKIKTKDLCKLRAINPEAFFKYCAGDAVSHFKACKVMKKHMEDTVPEKVKKYWYDVYLPLTNYLIDLEMTGLPIDVELMEKITNQYTTKYKEIYDQFQKLVVPDFMPEINPNSSPDKVKLLYAILKLVPPFYTKKGKIKSAAWYSRQRPDIKKQCNPSANNKSLSTLKFGLVKCLQEEELSEEAKKVVETNLLIVSTLLDLNRVGVFANKFFSKRGIILPEDLQEETSEVLPSEREIEEEDEDGSPIKQSYWVNLCVDKRIHPDFYECLDNFRTSSRPNVQNPASKVLAFIPDIFVKNYSKMSEVEKAKHEHLIPANLRQIFYSGSPDWLFGGLDISGADLAFMALLSEDELFTTDLRSGNFHERRMRAYFHDETLNKKKDPSKYVISKAITFNCSYTADMSQAAEPIQSNIYAENGLYVPLKEIYSALETWDVYEKYMKFRTKCLREVDTTEAIVNAHGIPFFFSHTESFGLLAGFYNTSLAYVIASELALFMHEACIETKKHMQKEGLWKKWIYPVNIVHDAAYFLIHKDLLKDDYIAEVLKWVFTDKVRTVNNETLGCEMEFSDRWYGEPVFHKETKYNFDKRIWEWK